MSLNNYFEKIFYINLDNRLDRRVLFEKQAKRLGFKAERFPAINGEEYWNVLRTPPAINAGELGCLASHVAIIASAKDAGLESVLIMEDDCVLHEKLNEKLPTLMRLVPAYWDMLYFGGCHAKLNDQSKPPIKLHPNLLKLNCTLTTVCYALRKDFIEKCYYGLEIGKYQIDVAYTQFQPTINAYAFWPNIAWQESGYSDIQKCDVNYDYPR